MKKKLLITAITILSVLFLYQLFNIQSKKSDIEDVVKSVCHTSGYDNWYKVVHNADGTYTAWCFNYEWDTIHFEM